MYNSDSLMFFFTFLLIWIAPLHSFHVSVAEIEYDTERHALEMSQRIFLDDLEKVLQNRTTKNFNIDDREEVVLPILNQYLEDKLAFYVNNKLMVFGLIGYQFDDDVLIAFVEVEGIKKPKNIRLKNSVLMDSFKNQVNLVHFSVKGNDDFKKTFKYDLKHQSHTLITN